MSLGFHHGQDDEKIAAAQHLENFEEEKVRNLGSNDAYELGGQALGTHQLEIQGRRVLIPTPSADPNDPLNWSQGYKIYTATLVCLAALMSNWVAAGPTVSIVQIAIYYTGLPPDVPKTAYFFTTTALFQGVSMFFWIPVINKIGRRPVYVVATVGYLLSTVWAVLSTGFNSHLAARIFIGITAGGAECLAPLVVGDLFFLHERGTYMAIYNVFLAFGVCGGIIIDGLIALNHDWQYMYWVTVIILGVLTVLVITTLEETAFRRPLPDQNHEFADARTDEERQKAGPATRAAGGDIPRKPFVKRMSMWSGVYTEESMFKMFIRPFGLIFLPMVFYATMLFSITIGFLVAISSNFTVGLGLSQGFTPTQSGLCFIGGFIGAMFGIPGGGLLADWVVKRQTRKNGGVFEPEMRLLAIAPNVIFGPLALILYGVGIEKKLHWIVPTIALGLLNFAIASATNISLVYSIDVLKPVSGEVVVAILGFKAIIGFCLSFSTNSWTEIQGYAGAFGEMAAISAFFFLTTIPLYIWGARIRQASLNWRLTKMILWKADRDDVMIVHH